MNNWQRVTQQQPSQELLRAANRDFHKCSTGNGMFIQEGRRAGCHYGYLTNIGLGGTASLELALSCILMNRGEGHTPVIVQL